MELSHQNQGSASSVYGHRGLLHGVVAVAVAALIGGLAADLAIGAVESTSTVAGVVVGIGSAIVGVFSFAF